MSRTHEPSKPHDAAKHDDAPKPHGQPHNASTARAPKRGPALAHLSDSYAVDTAGQAYSVAMGQTPETLPDGTTGVKACVLLTPIDVQVVEPPRPVLPERPDLPRPTPV